MVLNNVRNTVQKNYLIRKGNRQEREMTHQIILETEEVTISIEVIYSRRRSMALEVTGDGVVKARLPVGVSRGEAKRFVEAHREWIQNKYRRAGERRKNHLKRKLPAFEELSREQRAAMKQEFLERTEHFAKEMCVTYGRVSIRNQKTRWGSCSSKGNLNFNYRLYFLPAELMDYVIIHELAHRKYMNHSGDFWREVETYCHNARSCRKQLKEIGIFEG